MSAETFSTLFEAGFYLRLTIWTLAFVFVGRRYWGNLFRHRVFSPFLTAAAIIGTLALAESAFYVYLLNFQETNIGLRRVGGLVLAYSPVVDALVFMVFGLIALNHSVPEGEAT